MDFHQSIASRFGITTRKYEGVCLNGDADGREAKAGISAWFAFHHHSRPHQALPNRTLIAVWRRGLGGALEGAALDMTLRLDSAGAFLPLGSTRSASGTLARSAPYPLPPQPQQAA